MYYLHGGAGAPNFGDELIARQWIEFLGETVKDEITFSGYRKNVMVDLFADRYPGVHLTDELCKYQGKCPKDFWKAFQEGFTFLDDSNKRLSKFPAEELERLRASKVFHLHGGGYINTIWPKHAFYLGLAAAMKRHVGCTVIGTGLGITPIPAPPEEMKAMLAETFASFDVFEARDYEGYSYAKAWAPPSARIVQGLDDAFLSPVLTEGGGKTLHFCLHSNEHADELIKTIKQEFIDSFEHHKFWICHYKDVAQCANVQARWPQFVEVPMTDIAFGPLPIGRGDFFVTSRFHPHLMAARAGARGQFLAPGVYSKVKHGSVVLLGSRFVRAASNPKLAKTCPDMKASDPGRVAAKRTLWADATKIS